MSLPEKNESQPADAAALPSFAAEVRYSLPELLEQLKLERAVSSFGMDKLAQSEITKIFKAKAPLRAKPKK